MKNYKQRSKQAFDMQAKSYDHNQKGDHARKLYPFMIEEIIQVYGTKVLDMGCGTGALMSMVLDEDHGREITGIDLSEKMLEQAKQRMKDKAVLIQGDCENLPLESNYFDLVYCNDSFHHYPNPEKVCKEVFRVLKYGGTFLIGDCYLPFPFRVIMNCFMRYSSEGDVKIYSKKEMELLMNLYFHDIHWKKVTSQAMVIKGVK